MPGFSIQRNIKIESPYIVRLTTAVPVLRCKKRIGKIADNQYAAHSPRFRIRFLHRLMLRQMDV